MKFTKFAGLLAVLLPVALAAQQTQTAPPAALPAPAETIEVTSTRMAEPVAEDPALVTVITGEELRDRGATDLQSALALAAGVDIAPGGDSGPASSVPEFWGLREFDAFLLVVDGVPWGGAFNPALSTLDLTNVERIEVLRGGAPVSYGATAFVGVTAFVVVTAGVVIFTEDVKAFVVVTGLLAMIVFAIVTLFAVVTVLLVVMFTAPLIGFVTVSGVLGAAAAVACATGAVASVFHHYAADESGKNGAGNQSGICRP